MSKPEGEQIKRKPLNSLTPDPHNVRLHSASQIEQLARSLREFGQTKPLIVDEAGIIIAGNGTFRAAQAIGMETVAVVEVHGWSEAKKRAYAIADNKTGLNSTWDEAALLSELRLLESEVDIGLTGFDSDELADLFTPPEPIFTDPPETVVDNIARMDAIRQQRRKGNTDKAEKSDTEHYLVIVFPDRSARERACARLGLPEDERYVSSKAVRLEPRGMDGRLQAERSLKASDLKRSGATG